MRLFITALIPILAVAQSLGGQSRPQIPRGIERSDSRHAEPAPSPTPRSEYIAEATEDAEIIKVNTQLVSIPVRVLDKKGRSVGGLTKQDFRVFENGVEQEIGIFSNEHQPFTVALVLDMSYSTTFKLSEIQNAALAFIDQLRPHDKVMVISFDEEVHMLCEPTNDRGQIYRAIRSTRIATGTSLYEAMDLVMNERLRRIDGRKAVILFTDGVDTTSRRSNDRNNLDDALELDALVYSIRYDTFADVQVMKGRAATASAPPVTIHYPRQDTSRIPRSLPTVRAPDGMGTTVEEYEKAAQYLEELSIRTGGRLYDAGSLINLSDAYSRIASELREFYSIAYYPSEERARSRAANIKVRVDRPGLVVRSREVVMRRKDQK